MENNNKIMERPSTYETVKKREIGVKEMEISIQTRGLLRDRLRECVLIHRENANEKCMDLRVQYVEALQDRFGGFLFPAGKEPQNRQRRELTFNVTEN